MIHTTSRTRGELPRSAGIALFVLTAAAGAAAPAGCSSDDVREERDADARADAGTTETGAKRSLCVDGKPSPYPGPPRIDLFGTVPALDLPKMGGGTFSFTSRFEPCAPRSKLIVIRTTAAFCGPCRWSAAHTRDVIPGDVSDRAELVDLVVSDKNNAPVRTSADADRAALELGGHADVLAADPAYTFQTVGLGDRRLPFYVMIDSRTMEIRRFEPDPEPETITSMIRREVALLDGRVPPQLEPIRYDDGIFPKNHWDLLHEMTLPGPPPPDPTNGVADSPLAAALGKDLFFDAALSPSGVSCGTCHDPAKGFADGRPRGVGAAEGDRNTPSVLYASHARFQFWDGRADTLWLQAAGPIENPIEMASTRVLVARRVVGAYKARYEAVFPGAPLPPMQDPRFPESAKPGDASWGAMSEADRVAVTRVLVNVAKAIAAYERTLKAKPNTLDRYIGGDLSALTKEEKTGLHTFFTAGCAQCHYGPRLTDDAFHNIRFATGRRDGKADMGASLGLAALGANELRRPEWADGPFPAHTFPPNLADMAGTFRTPTLRGITRTAPYGHGGTLATLDDVAKHYGTAGLPESDPTTFGRADGWVPNFVEQHQRELVPAMKLFTADLEP